MRIVLAGSSLSRGEHAGLHRSLTGALALRGHAVLFLERRGADPSWAADPAPPFGVDARPYGGVADLDAMRPDIAKADLVLLGAGSPELAPFLRDASCGMTVFLDLDTSATAGPDGYGDEAARGFDLYLSSCGGLVPRQIERRLGLPARAFTAWADPQAFASVETTDDETTDDDAPNKQPERQGYDLGFLGDHHEDRRALLERLLCDTARRMPRRRFVVAGQNYPETIRWPANVDRVGHVPSDEKAAFYASLDWALSLPRPARAAAGFSPEAALVEALASGPAIISTGWRGLSTMFVPGTDLLIAGSTSDVVAALGRPKPMRNAIARAGRARMLMGSTAARRAAALEAAVAAWAAPAKRRAARAPARA